MSAARRRLLAWYDEHARDLPFRRTRDPYAIWVSEVMLQQTRVETVLPYWERFLERFPTVSSLAEAPLDDVLGLWSGLGYYRRARLLHAGAIHVRDVHGGVVPRDPVEIRAIPGVGAYTTGAIASFAFGLEEALVDGNVARVLSRVFAITTDPRRGAGLLEVWRRARELVVGERPDTLNNALMELGATVCASTNPACAGCPLRPECVAHATGRTEELPVRGEKTVRPVMHEIALRLRFEGRLVLVRRLPAGLFGGLWEAPRVALPELAAACERVGTLLGGRVTARGRGRAIRHVLTHRELQVRVFDATLDRAPVLASTELWDRVEVVNAIDGRGISTLGRRVLGVSKTEAGHHSR